MKISSHREAKLKHPRLIWIWYSSSKGKRVNFWNRFLVFEFISKLMIYWMRMRVVVVVVEVSSHINQWWASQAHEIEQAPLFKRLTRPEAPDMELNRGKKKLTQEKIREIALRFRWKAEKFKVEKLTWVKIREIAGKFEIGNYLELRWWKIGSALHFRSWLAHHRGGAGWGGQKLMKEFKLT